MQDCKLASFPLQIWMGASPPESNKMEPIQKRRGWNKPIGGLWTSSYNPETGLSDWVQWCLDNYTGGLKPHLYVMYPSPAARLYTIDGYDDLVRLLCSHPCPGLIGRNYLDFEALSSAYDALHVTDRGIIETSLVPIMVPGSHDGRALYGWDAESTLWFRWRFDAVEALPIDPRTLQRDEEEENNKCSATS